MKGKLVLLVLALIAAYVYLNGFTIPFTSNPMEKISAIEKRLEISSFMPAIEALQDYKTELLLLRKPIDSGSNEGKATRAFIDAKISAVEGMLLLNQAKKTVEFSSPLSPDCFGALNESENDLQQAKEKLNEAKNSMDSAFRKYSTELKKLDYFSKTDFDFSIQAMNEAAETLEGTISDYCF